MGRGFSEHEDWLVSGVIGVKGQRDGVRQSMLLQVGFGDGVRCSRSLLYRLPLSFILGVVILGKDGEGGVARSIMMSEGEK